MLEKVRFNRNKIIEIIITFSCLMLLNVACLKIGTARLGIDYTTFYTTGKMILSGNISSIYDMTAHHAALEQYFGTVPYLLEWIYPPTFLLPIVPLSYLGYDISFIFWLVATFALAAISVYYLTNKDKRAPFLLFLFPGTFLNIRWGQNGFLTAALFGFGVYFVETNPLLAGLAFGLLTFKPQMAIFPFMILLLLKKWKAVGWSCVFACAIAVLSGLVFGFDTWLNFFLTAQENASLLSASWAGTNWGIPTLSTALRCMGLSGWILNSILILVAGISIYACVRIWRTTTRISFRAMALVLCLFLSFPYISLYDYAIFGIPFTLLFFDLVEKREQAFHPYALLLLWILPMVCLFLFVKTNIQLLPFVLIGYMVVLVVKTSKQSAKQMLLLNPVVDPVKD